MLLSHVIRTCHHHMSLSYVIRTCHYHILWHICNIVMLFFCNKIYFATKKNVIITCHCHMSLQNVIITCDYHMSLHHVIVTCHYIMSLSHVFTTCHRHLSFQLHYIVSRDLKANNPGCSSPVSFSSVGRVVLQCLIFRRKLCIYNHVEPPWQWQHKSGRPLTVFL